MKNNTTKLLIILAVLLGIFLIVKFTKDGSRSRSFRSSLVEIDTADVTMIRITSENDSTTIQKEGDQWMVNGKAADRNAVKSLLNNLRTITPTRIASRSADDWEDFQVDDQGTRVKVFEGSDKTLDIILGRFNVEGQRSFYSYVRLAEDEDTYVAGDFMKMSIGTGSADYRNDDILRLKVDSLASIDFQYPDSAFSLYRVNGNWQLEGDRTDSVNTAQYLRGLNFVTSKNFLNDPPEGSADYHVVYKLRNGESIRVSAYGRNILGSTYNEKEFWQDEAVYQKLFKGRTFFSR